ncbi:hypothetical protein JAAARDRAFT_36783 [Jaapia argillacea MUCL 33604]|uniref:Uncharacterized protein n=1 Tax=Jaapia argillacea MUCL 33604 TaxID=933084 RepID=A0A067PMI4_9AGAM|nr:hypothetical protein JAAARDRAFT_36783 [Jaapia argillacea MUCL 33604]
MSSYQLRPASVTTGSSSSISPSPPMRSPPSTGKSSSTMPSPPSSMSSRPRRPLSPSSLRDVDLSSNANLGPRIYPPPPTGHDLMAMFPPPPPPNFMESTSGYFQRQERAYFAQKGKEIVRVQVELDVQDSEMVDVQGRGKYPTVSHQPPRGWPAGQSPHPQSSIAPGPYAHQQPSAASIPRVAPRGAPIPIQPTSPYSHMSQPPHALPPPSSHSNSSRSSNDSPPKSESQSDDPDESWRRPIPHAERRRAGKHTKRVIVKT